MQFSCVNLRKGERQNKKFFFWGIVSSFIWLIYFHSLLIHKTILHSYDQVIQSTFLTMWLYLANEMFVVVMCTETLHISALRLLCGLLLLPCEDYALGILPVTEEWEMWSRLELNSWPGAKFNRSWLDEPKPSWLALHKWEINVYYCMTEILRLFWGSSWLKQAFCHVVAQSSKLAL